VAAVEEQRKAIAPLDSCFVVLRDKTQALAIMVGDLQDRPGGSLRERVSTIEDHLMHMNWKDEILQSLPQKNPQNQSLPELLNEELDRLEDFEDPGEPEHEVKVREVPAEEIDPAKSLRAEDHIE